MSFLAFWCLKLCLDFMKLPPPKKKTFPPPRVDAILSFSSWSSLLGFVVFARLTARNVIWDDPRWFPSVPKTQNVFKCLAWPIFLSGTKNSYMIRGRGVAFFRGKRKCVIFLKGKKSHACFRSSGISLLKTVWEQHLSGMFFFSNGLPFLYGKLPLIALLFRKMGFSLP